MAEANFNLRDYLKPGGNRSYDSLASDLQAAHDAGDTVYLWGLGGSFMLAGHPGMMDGRSWSDGQRWYQSARDCLNKKNGVL
jgi:hypothetical protein